MFMTSQSSFEVMFLTLHNPSLYGENEKIVNTPKKSALLRNFANKNGIFLDA